MSDVFFSIQAKLLENGNEKNGIFIIQNQSLSFKQESTIVFDKKVEWKDVYWKRTVELVTRLLLFKTEKIQYAFFIQNVEVCRIVIDESVESRLLKVLELVKTRSIQFAERKRQEELARQEAERKRQEELARQEAERKRQEELARQEAERKRQEELARQEAERKRQEELARQEAERKRQEELARQEAERKRQEELARQEAERKRQEELARQEAERKRQEELARQEVVLSQEEEDNKVLIQKRKEEVAQQAAARKYRREKEIENEFRKKKMKEAYEKAKLRRKKEEEKEREYKKRREELKRLESERKQKQDLTSNENECKESAFVQRALNQTDDGKLDKTTSRIEVERIINEVNSSQTRRYRQEEILLHNHVVVPQYKWLKEKVENGLYNCESVVGESTIRYSQYLFEEFVLAKYNKEYLEESWLDEIDISYNELALNPLIMDSLRSVISNAVYYRQYDTAMLLKLLEIIISIASNHRSSEYVYVEDDDYFDGGSDRELLLTSSKQQDDNEEIQKLISYIETAQRREAQIARHAETIEKKVLVIHSYILSQIRPVTLGQIRSKFAHCSRELMLRVVEKGSVLDYYDRFLAKNNCKIKESIINDLTNKIYSLCDYNDGICHIEQVYESFRYQYRDFLAANYVDEPKHLYGFLSGFCTNTFGFLFPYIARKGIHIEPPELRLRKYVYQHSEITVDDILLYAKQHYIKYNGLLDFLNSLNDRMLIKNRKTVISIDKTDLSWSKAVEIEKRIKEELIQRNYCAIRELNCMVKFPKCSIPYDEWLIYSILLKWGTEVYIQTTQGQFRYSIPVVSIRGYLGKKELSEIANRFAGNTDYVLTSKVDDLDSIDELIMDYIDLDDIYDLDNGDIDDIDEWDDIEPIED